MIEIFDHDEILAVSGGDAAATRIPGQNSWGEWMTGGAEFYNMALESAMEQIARDVDRANFRAAMLDACAVGNLLLCTVMTFQELSASLEDAAKVYQGTRGSGSGGSKGNSPIANQP